MSRLLIQLLHLSKSFGPSSLFSDISLSINHGDRFALVGENGSGKTTLFRILVGLISPDSGRIIRSSDVTIGLLPQEVTLTHPHVSVRTHLEEGPLTDLQRKMDECLVANRLVEWEKLHEEYERQGGYRGLPLEKVMKGLQLEPFLDVSMLTLSSGQRVRVALAKALIENPDLLLLDEPTNHLDQGMVHWLHEMIRSRAGATVIVSHDRRFLNTTCNHLIEIQNGSLTCYGGNYDFYLEERNRLLERQMTAYESQVEEKELIKQKIKEMTFSKPKPPPPSDRNIMYYDKRGEHHQKSLKRTLDILKGRLEEIERNPLHHPRPKSIKGLFFHSVPLPSRVAIEFESIGKSFDDKVLFSRFSRTLCGGDRVIVRGPNGSGKTTLLRCAIGSLKPDSGCVRRGSGIKIAYLDQEVALLPMEDTPLMYFERKFRLTMKDILSELHKAALCGADLLNRSFSSLSVGQRKRLMLLSLILEKPNVLVLDEPTNHLDFLTLEAFEKALLEFDGAILAVSHDATFIEKIATEEWSL